MYKCTMYEGEWLITSLLNSLVPDNSYQNLPSNIFKTAIYNFRDFYGVYA